MPKVTIKPKCVLGVTGGIASGKTTVLRLLARAGIPTISADDLAHQAIRKGTPAYARILKRYGRSILGNTGQISRADLGRIVFSRPAELRWLEAQVHPVVIRKIKQFVRARRGIVALDIPLLFEAKLQNLVSRTIVVYCSQAQQIERLRRRNGFGRQKALRRIRAQMPLAVKRRRADVVIDNRGTPADLRRQVERKINLDFAKAASIISPVTTSYRWSKEANPKK